MRSESFTHLVAYSVFIARAAAKGCCWGDVWSSRSWLWLRWDDHTVKCGLNGELPPNSRCVVENLKDENGNIQALTNVTFGNQAHPFMFRLGIDPWSCNPLPDDKVVTGWEGWGAYMFKGHELTTQKWEVCDRYIS
ncbi:hypothetical protein LZ30DRAFT_688933 [Colletotrichum cereale]|nr:hypothetical protein LZ30DRAFT_688933 [Colletotrichum cereale]